MNMAIGTIFSSEHLARYSFLPVSDVSSAMSSCMISAISASDSRSLSQVSSES